MELKARVSTREQVTTCAVSYGNIVDEVRVEAVINFRLLDTQDIFSANACQTYRVLSDQSWFRSLGS